MNSWVKPVLSACMGGLVTFGIMYVAVVGRYVTRSEVSQMISTESPYVRDAKWIEKEMTSLGDKMDDLGDKMDQLLNAR